MSSLSDEIYLGALLHDIGKFYQRADKKFYDSAELKEQSHRIAQQICPKTQAGYFTHLHVVWTNEFFEQYEKLFAKYAHPGEITDNVANLASYHHRPKTVYQSMIQMADWWASGLDRSQIGDYDVEGVKTDKERYKQIPLSNILGALKIKEKDNDKEGKNTTEPTSFKLNPLSLERNAIFPNPYELNSREEYEKLWQQFVTKLGQQNFNTSSIRDFSITLFYILKQYTWSIPSFTQEDFPCISLFEHLKITSAITQCLFDYYSEDETRFSFDTTKCRLRISDEAYPLLLTCFDLSGIQSFLYNISTTNAAKSLRGRSYYLQMLLESLSWYLIREIPDGFTPSHIIYASGGKFYMLLPNTAKVNKLLADLNIKIQEELWSKHRGELYLNIGKVAFRYENDIKKDKPNIKIQGDDKHVFLGTLWERVFQDTNRHEGRKYSELLKTGKFYSDLFEPSGEGGNEKSCSVTGLEYKLEDLYAFSDDDGNHRWINATKAGDLTDIILISKTIKEQIDLGRKLVSHRFSIFTGEDEESQNCFYGLPHYCYTISDTEKNTQSKALIVQNFSEATLFPGKMKGSNQAWAFRYFGGARVAMNGTEPKTYEEIAEYEHESGFTRLGVLRMDVDNLGMLFVDGFKEWDEIQSSEIAKNASFSAYATFSGLLDLFFSGYINTLRNKPEYKDNLNIIYSGGDDVFAIGRWDTVIDFAAEVRKEFRDFTGRDDISISAGIDLVPPKFPLSKAAENAGLAERQAKDNITRDGFKKNAICILDTPVNWDKEWPTVLELKEKLSKWLEKEYITKGLLMFLLRLYSKWKYKKEVKNEEDYSWKWNAAYNIARRQNKITDKSGEVYKALEDLKSILFARIGSNQIRFEIFALACRLVELEKRTQKIK